MTSYEWITNDQFSHFLGNMSGGLVFNIQKYSVEDGPGIRTTVFLKGCPMSCRWCHNPEGRLLRSEIYILEGRCVMCGECREACPFENGEQNGAPAALPARKEACILCGACVDACPTEARQMAGRRMTVEEVMSEVWRDRIFYEDSGGGVTFSGGEPLMQSDFLLALLDDCQERGLHTAVDTCGFVPRSNLLAAAERTDLFLYDLKMIDEAKHLEHTGAAVGPILENLRALSRVHANIWIRVPVIPGVNDDDAELGAIARFAGGIPGVQQVNLLPYHRIGVQKAKRLGQTNRMSGAEPPSVERMERALSIFSETGVRVRAGGGG